MISLGNSIGDACEWDFDGDGTENDRDVCPFDSKIEMTDFTNLLEVPLDSLVPNDTTWLSSEHVRHQKEHVEELNVLVIITNSILFLHSMSC